jgi:hypothetical protein
VAMQVSDQGVGHDRRGRSAADPSPHRDRQVPDP